MSILSRVLGPESRYDRRLPYTYEVTVPVAGVKGMTHSYISDTLCGLLECLDREKVQPPEIRQRPVRTTVRRPLMP